MHLSRIYRDMRMHPSTYYKDSLWFHLEQDGHGAVLESPLLCFDINPEGYRFWLPARVRPRLADGRAAPPDASSGRRNFCVWSPAPSARAAQSSAATATSVRSPAPTSA